MTAPDAGTGQACTGDSTLKNRSRQVGMTWSPQSGSLGLATLRQRYHEGTLRPTEFIEAVYERIARCAVPYIQALAALAETLQGLPRVTGSAT